MHGRVITVIYKAFLYSSVVAMNFAPPPEKKFRALIDRYFFECSGVWDRDPGSNLSRTHGVRFQVLWNVSYRLGFGGHILSQQTTK